MDIHIEKGTYVSIACSAIIFGCLICYSILTSRRSEPKPEQQISQMEKILESEKKPRHDIPGKDIYGITYENQDLVFYGWSI